MKISFLIYSLGAGGAERSAASRANYLSSKKEWDVSIITFAGIEEDFYRLNPEIKRISLKENCGIKGGLINNLKRIYFLRRYLKDLKPDILICEMPAANIIGIMASFTMSHKVIIEERIHPPKMELPLIWKILRKVLYRFSDGCAALTVKTADWLKENCGCDTEAIPNFISYPLGGETQEPQYEIRKLSDKKIILALGRLDYQKGFDILINAFSKISKKYPKWDMVIVGEGSLRKELEKLSQTLDLAERIHLPGNTLNPSFWYKKASIFVLSSRYEGFPNVLLEAMSYGLPSISFDCETGPSDIIKNGENGILLKDISQENLREAMENLILDERLREKISKEAVKVRETFSKEKICFLWEIFLNKVKYKQRHV
ncbi:MAG: glycosyltransferase family 4 protein [Elusimicrobiota bacterium]